MERLEQDERMRKPWQAPPAPKKPILRKGEKQKLIQVAGSLSQPPTAVLQLSAVICVHVAHLSDGHATFGREQREAES